MTKIRLGRSELNMHKFLIGQSESAECSCHFKNESSQHYFIDCFLYSSERQTLFNQVEQFIPKLKSLNKYKQHEILINGININDPDFHYTNTSLSIAVQTLIFKSKKISILIPPLSHSSLLYIVSQFDFIYAFFLFVFPFFLFCFNCNFKFYCYSNCHFNLFVC